MWLTQIIIDMKQNKKSHDLIKQYYLISVYRPIFSSLEDPR